jgi:hypothetical protein
MVSIVGVLMFKGGRLMALNHGRRTASLRALRILFPGIILLVICYLLLNVQANPFVGLVGIPLMWTMLAIWIILLITCLNGKNSMGIPDEHAA